MDKSKELIMKSYDDLGMYIPDDAQVNYDLFKAELQIFLDSIPEWISVEDRLPEKLEYGRYKRYLIGYKDSDSVYECSWLNGEWHQRHDGCSQKYPTHWQPLPSPPIEDK